MADELFQTPVGRLSYPALFEKNAYENNTPKHEATFIFDEKAQEAPEFLAIAARYQELKAKHYPDGFPDGVSSPFRKGESKGKRVEGEIVFPAGYRPGLIFIKARSDHQPEIVDLGGVAITNPREIYAGCFVRGFISVYYYDKGKSGISFGLTSVQKCYDGEPFSAVSRPMADKYAGAPAMPEGASSTTQRPAGNGATSGGGLLD